MSRNSQKTVITIIAGILVAMMVLSLLPAAGFAEDAGQASDVIAEEAALPGADGEARETAGTEEQLSFEAAYADSSAAGTLVYENGEWHWYNENGVFDQTKTGLVDFDGGRFYVVNGVLSAESNGLTLIDGVWYFLSQGQLQVVTQWAEYDGYWFYITNGILDTAKNGLMSYNGGQFLVAAGQIKKETSGLWHNEKTLGGDGSWVFLANGQVQTQHTGLTQYDGAWFYVENGRLAEDFTGVVEYNGSKFQVENGMVTGEVKDEVWDPDIVFTTTDLYGNEYTDRIFADADVTMLNMWAYWCGPCINELQDLQKLQNNYAGRGLQIFGVSYDNYSSGNRQEFERQGITYPSLIATDSLDEYLYTGYVPTTIFVDRNGHILCDEPYIGSADYSYWASVVEGYMG